jgi:hypothetical protein
MPQSATKSNDAFAQGCQARARGLPQDAAPYPAGSEEALAWSEGWKSADQPLEELSPEERPFTPAAQNEPAHPIAHRDRSS